MDKPIHKILEVENPFSNFVSCSCGWSERNTGKLIYDRVSWLSHVIMALQNEETTDVTNK